jgi:hypothetical protein
MVYIDHRAAGQSEGRDHDIEADIEANRQAGEPTATGEQSPICTAECMEAAAAEGLTNWFGQKQ